MERLYTTGNGIPIYCYSNMNVSGFSLSLYLRAGSMFESGEENGSTHFFEHAVFRHLNKLYNGRLYEMIDACGLSFEASTGVKYVEFNITGVAGRFGMASRVLSDVFTPFTLTQAELRPEKGRVKAEIREEDSASSFEHFCAEAIWQGTSLSNTVSGTAGGVDRIGVKRLKSLQQELLSTENLFFYAAGHVSSADIEMLARLLEIEPTSHAQLRRNVAPVPPSFGRREGNVHVKNSPFTSVCMSFDCSATVRSLPALYLAWDMLYSGEMSILHHRLSERSGLIYSFDGYIEAYDNLSLITLTYDVRADKLYQSVEEAILAFASVAELAEKHLPYVLPAYTDNAPLLRDTPSSLTSTFGYEGHILSQGYRSVEERSETFCAVSASDIEQLAASTFRASALTLAVKANKSKLDTERLLRLFELLG